jgi:hypothetical protein
MDAHPLLEAALDFYRAEAGKAEHETAAMLGAVVTELASCAGAGPVLAPRACSAASLLPDAVTRVQSDSCRSLATAMSEAAPLFRWRQNPNYTVANMGAAFMAGYGYVEFAGPKDALFHAPGIRVGVLLLGPGLHYPLHAHPAEEIYHPLTDGGLWRRGEEDWRAVPAGQSIHHPPMMAHETKATDRTLLALYCWRGDTATEARLTA